MAHRMAAAIVGVLLAGCTSVYVQTGDHGSIERSTDFERSVRGRATSTTPAKPPPAEDEKR